MKKILKFVFSFIVACLLFYFLVLNLGERGLGDIFFSIRWHFVFFAFLVYTAVNGVRALRFYYLLDNAISKKRIILITLIHNFLINLLPFRTGELSYIYLVKKFGVPSGSFGVGSLLISRFFDLIIIANLVLISLYFVSAEILSFRLSALIFTIALVLILFSLGFLFSMSSFFRWLAIVTQKIQARFAWLEKLFVKVMEMEASFLKMRNRAYFFKIFVLSLLIWLLNFWVGLLLFRGLALDFNFWETVFLFSLPMVASEISPVQSFANIGLYEWSLVGGMLVLGLAKEAAVGAGVIIHALEIFFAMTLGLAGFLNNFSKDVPKSN